MKLYTISKQYNIQTKKKKSRYFHLLLKNPDSLTFAEPENKVHLLLYSIRIARMLLLRVECVMIINNNIMLK